MNNESPIQLTLGINLDDDAKFENFYTTDVNQPLFNELQGDFVMLYVWGASGTGCSHLLQSVCHKTAAEGTPAIYIPMAELGNYSPVILEGLTSLNVICIDDVQSIAGNSEWENAFFNFFNEAKEAEARLLFSADCSPQELSIILKDLRSRLQSIPVFKLETMSDKQSIEALKFRANQRGMGLNDATADFIYRRSNRSIDQLMVLLNKLDRVSMVKKRRLTIPLVKETMNW